MFDMSYFSVDFGGDQAKAIAYGAIGCAAVLLVMTAWSSWGYPRWGKFMDSRKRDSENLTLMVNHQVGALEYLISDNQMTPQDMWRLAPKYDHIPGFRTQLRDMLKKYLPEKEVPKTKLSQLSLT